MFPKPKIALISGGEIPNREGFLAFLEREKAVVVCADKGAEHLLHGAIVPTLVVGDMDSLSATALDYFTKKGASLQRHPARKDQTDTALALQAAAALKPKSVNIYGALGGRIDHTLANISLLAKGIPGAAVKIVQNDCELFIVSGSQQLRGSAGQLVSLFPFGGDAFGVTISGFEYELVEGTLRSGDPLGISNVLLSTSGVLMVREGALLVIKHFQEPLW